MYQEPIFLKPVFQERIWGGQKLKKEFNYDIPFERTGEAWVISAHSNGPSVITNGPLAGKTLEDAWKYHGELFNRMKSSNEAYPLLVKILDANENLSVQVHPCDHYAREVEGQPYGKTECWYVLSAEDGAELIVGHYAETQEQLINMLEEGKWESLLKRVKVKPGDFVYVPSGTIHAIGKGIVILETQQSSDITYRVYDYDREDANGNKRPLHMDRSKEVITIPHQDTVVEHGEEVVEGLTVQKLVAEKYFTVYRWILVGTVTCEMDKDFLQVSVIDGDAEIRLGQKRFHVKKGTHFVLPHRIGEYEIHGKAEFVVSHV